jgi:hypothetical protein
VSFLLFGSFGEEVGEKGKLKQVVTLGPESGVFLHEALDELLGLGWHFNGVADFILIDLCLMLLTLTIFSMTTFRCSPSNGTRPCSSS